MHLGGRHDVLFESAGANRCGDLFRQYGIRAPSSVLLFKPINIDCIEIDQGTYAAQHMDEH